MINEYIVTVDNKMFKVYGHNKVMALNQLKEVCRKYSRTSNDSYRDFWQNIKEKLDKSNYTIIKNEDFSGVVRVF